MWGKDSWIMYEMQMNDFAKARRSLQRIKCIVGWKKNGLTLFQTISENGTLTIVNKLIW